MKAITKIMVACDLSKYSKETLEYAAHLAEKLQAELIIVNVINQRDIDIILKVAEGQFDRSIETYVEKSAEEYVKRVKEERTREIEKLIKATSPENLSVKKIFKTGVPFQELIRAVEEEEPNIMVMGRKGRSDLAGVLFGPVAEKMFRCCPVPLLSVRPENK
ncbi:universal stress protein [Desulfonema magnum]|uniref:Universal stress protein family protein n=1 Tax=Desulfonema magnum TaxID=45655 RepID=A0A975BJ41_9BACT|nr:universal stress protein [Desulfonema magnum]QTA86256.1 Universal stress protein family protein [Desulfonema magnum]